MTDEELAKWIANKLRECEGDPMSGQYVDEDCGLDQTTIDGNFNLVALAKAILDKLGRPVTFSRIPETTTRVEFHMPTPPDNLRFVNVVTADFDNTKEVIVIWRETRFEEAHKGIDHSALDHRDLPPGFHAEFVGNYLPQVAEPLVEKIRQRYAPGT
jgi:hypothetical protein